MFMDSTLSNNTIQDCFSKKKEKQSKIFLKKYNCIDFKGYIVFNNITSKIKFFFNKNCVVEYRTKQMNT